MSRVAIGAGALILGLAFAGCGDQELREQQTQILEKLAKLEEGQKKILEARPAARRPPSEDFNKVHKIDVGSSPIKGNPNAPVTVVEFSDFQCPFCARSLPLLKQVADKYPDQVRIVYKHFPLNFHAQARPAAIAAIAAQEQGRFWEYHDVLFENIQKLGTADWDGFAKEAGLDVARFKKDVELFKDSTNVTQNSAAEHWFEMRLYGDRAARWVFQKRRMDTCQLAQNTAEAYQRIKYRTVLC